MSCFLHDCLLAVLAARLAVLAADLAVLAARLATVLAVLAALEDARGSGIDALRSLATHRADTRDEVVQRLAHCTDARANDRVGGTDRRVNGSYYATREATTIATSVTLTSMAATVRLAVCHCVLYIRAIFTRAGRSLKNFVFFYDF